MSAARHIRADEYLIYSGGHCAPRFIKLMSTRAAQKWRAASQSVSVIDVLLARALARACFDLDYSEEMALARRFAAFQERRAA